MAVLAVLAPMRRTFMISSCVGSNNHHEKEEDSRPVTNSCPREMDGNTRASAIQWILNSPVRLAHTPNTFDLVRSFLSPRAICEVIIDGRLQPAVVSQSQCRQSIDR